DRTLQHVVATTELVRALDRDDVARLFDDTHDVRVASLVTTERAQLAFGEVVTTPAPRDALLGFDDRVREPPRVFGRGLQEVEREGLRRLGADAGQPPEFVDEGLHRAFVDSHAIRASAPARRAHWRGRSSTIWAPKSLTRRATESGGVSSGASTSSFRSIIGSSSRTSASAVFTGAAPPSTTGRNAPGASKSCGRRTKRGWNPSCEENAALIVSASVRKRPL